jgi:predicted DCC family thiol-disulfide oxidoreductase YuxK
VTHSAPVWLYDGVCILCSGAVRYVLKHERNDKMRFVAIQSDEGNALAVQHGIDPENPDSFLFIEDGQAYAKSDGVLRMLKFIRGPARVIAIGAVFPKSVRDWFYDRIAKNRYRIFGRSNVCMVPAKNVKHRFSLPALRQK